MPEGPEIRRAADSLEAAIKGKPLTDAWFAFPQLKPYETQLIGQSVTHIETRGKALLTHFTHNLTLYSHNQLYGVWRVINVGEQLQTNRVLRVRLQTAEKAILLYSASDIEMLTPEQLLTHPFLQRVGPDVLDLRLTADEVKARLLSPAFRNRQFSGLLLDQAFLAGLGNYLRVEILWEVGLAGQRKASELNEVQVDALSHALLEIPRLSYNTRGVVDENKHHGALFRFKVFHREGKPCERCGGTIERTMLSSRPFYWCPQCQE
ncbi:endonuclease VIII [Lelliottia sp. V106_10]|uniref:endonuclease VIII n=1 Tax=Lelliottia wanjuensis TaxID=3050585 RepID=UPI00254E4B06|nr:MULTISPECIES: endonuclease VIII [unclassified Lelliottia]MDK9358739.1 endonuclease VIII [Lelliottia sp. V106_16]MDK9375985.1 endonuclease VIII [Lelliottia sp. V106_10]MDK9602794.1 endonuclease VIII [Lelliottia sp. V106_5]